MIILYASDNSGYLCRYVSILSCQTSWLGHDAPEGGDATCMSNPSGRVSIVTDGMA